MRFSNSYFEDEVRDGFYVSGMMKRAWAAQLEILEDIDKVCKKNNIQYFAEWGTLLGAVRHGGFIPWDDDLDICMKRADYKKFLAVARQELPEGYGLLNCHNEYNGEVYYEFLTRVVNGNQICFDERHLEKFHGFPYVSGIDIFPLDYYASDNKEQQIQKKLVDLLSVVISCADSTNFNQDELEVQLRQVEEICNVTIERDDRIKQQLYLLEERIFSMYDEREAEEITMMPLGLENARIRFPKNYYQEAVMLPFENTQLPVPVFYDMILRKKYGDYLKPVHKGGSHEYPFYKRQEDVLQELYGVKPLKYIISTTEQSSVTG